MDRKEQILEVATNLFSEKGFENTALSEVCKVAHVSKGLIFHHFKSKNDLLREIFKRTTDVIIEINTLKQNHSSPIGMINELLITFFRQLEVDKRFFQFNLNVMLQPATREILNDLIKERSSYILNSVKRIFFDVDGENFIALSYMFIAELDGVAFNYLYSFNNYPLAEIKQQLLNKYNNTVG